MHPAIPARYSGVTQERQALRQSGKSGTLRMLALLALCLGAALTALTARADAPATAPQGQQLTIPFYYSGARAARGNVSVVLSDVQLTLQGSSSVSLTMQFALSGTRLPKGYVAELVPRFYTAKDSVDLPAVRIMGSRAYRAEQRSPYAPDPSVMEYRDRDAYEPQPYAQTTAFRPWMKEARLKFVVSTLDGCGDSRGYAEGIAPLPYGSLPATVPLRADRHEVVTTQRTLQLQGTAYISFPQNRTEINPDYLANRTELQRISHSVDSLRRQKDIIMKHLSLKGYASPEGSYTNNAMLANGRVHSLKRYLVDALGLDPDIISVDYEAEDWQGLRRYVDASAHPMREALLAVIDSDQDPDRKLRTIQMRFPRTYRFLLDSVFTHLRHTDYRVDYVKAWEEKEQKTVSTVTDSLVAGYSAVPWMTQGPMPSPTGRRIKRYKPILAVKTNLLFDAALCPNVELEMPLARRGAASRWSIMGEWWFPWWRLDHNPAGDVNRYLRSDQRPTRKSYELLTGSLELRYWLAPRCGGTRPWLTGTFVGFYAAGGKYDFEWDSQGSQGEFVSAGLSVGHSWAIARHWNLELSAAAGYIYTPYRYYEAEFDDTHLIYRYTSSKHLFLPTKLKLSIVYILGKKGGRR